jgi:hypothetical protein
MAYPSLTTENIRKIEKLIGIWQTKLTWGLLVDRIALELNIQTTRQTLDTYKSIKATYAAKKQELRGSVPKEFIKFKQSDVQIFETMQSLKSQLEIVTKHRDHQLVYIRKVHQRSQSNPSLTHLLNDVKKSLEEN